MKIEIIKCDLCDEQIVQAEDEPFVIRAGHGAIKKQVGCDFVLTPRGHRVYARNQKAMIRVSASFYCGFHDDDVDELHFHHQCLDREVRKRVIDFFKEGE